MAESEECSKDPSFTVFISCETDGEDSKLADLITEELQARDIDVFTYDDITGGTTCAEGVAKSIKDSDRFIHVVTKKYMSVSPWRYYETIKAAKKVQRTGQRSIIFLLHGVNKDELPKIALFQDTPKFSLELEEENGKMQWKKSQVDKVVSKLKEDRRVRDILPAGNVAHGQVWSHFIGFLNIITQKVLTDRIKSCVWYKESEGQNMPIKVYELIPESCNFPSGNLSNGDRLPQVEYAGALESYTYNHAGNESRPVSPAVYRITDEKEMYYCVAEYPSTLGMIHKMVDSGLTKLTEQQRHVQLARFYYTMNGVLNHKKNAHCHNKARLVLFNDNTDNMGEVLLAAVKEDLQEGTGGNPRTTRSPAIDALESAKPPITTTRTYDAVVLYNENEVDEGIYNKIQEHFRTENLTLSEDQHANKTLLTGLEENINNCRWLIVVLSKEALQDNWLTFSAIAVLTSCLEEGTTRVIPLLVDVTYDDIPDYLDWVMYIHIQSDPLQYLARLSRAVRGEDNPMSLEYDLPAGDVAYGLAWAYVINYLRFVIPGFIEFIPAAFTGDKTVKNYVCPDVLYILLPRTCRCPGSLVDKHTAVTRHNDLKHIHRMEGGTHRAYTLDVYKITDPLSNQDLYFVGQFAAPLLTLHQMNELGIAGLKDETMREESVSFCRIVHDILEGPLGRHQDTASHCQFVQYDDTDPQGLEKVLVPLIRDDWRKQEKAKQARWRLWRRRAVSGSVLVGVVAVLIMTVYRVHK